MALDFCICFVDDAVKTVEAGKGRAALVSARKWDRGSKIRIRFVEDRGAALEARIRSAAQEWLDRAGANLTWVWVKDEPSDIRISFSAPGSWSTLGTDCRSPTWAGKATMNFGWLSDGSSDVELRRVVLHEFGHALGLIHEHQNPLVDIPWDKDAVYRDVGQQWSRDKIDHNLFEAYAREAVSTKGYDKSSIMHYPVPEHWTTGVFSVPQNNDLSAGDLQLIRAEYA